MILQIIRYVGATLIIAVMATVVTVYYRESYEHSKRLRVVEPDHLYRSGQMTGAGFRDAFTRYNIKTVVNLQEDNTDP